MPATRLCRLALALFAMCSSATCGSNTPTTPTRDWIEIVSIAPARGTTLGAAQRITVTVTVSVTLASKDGGYVVLIISDQGNRTLNAPAGAEARVTLTKGSRTVTLSDTVTAPGTGGKVTASAALFVDGSNRTAAYQSSEFPVQ